ncbi:MAG: hypothetical protein U5J83_02790 [Bryobacterales bacterium]|nr:hypothetical protein [Bryobacterales bacterium]
MYYGDLKTFLDIPEPSSETGKRRAPVTLGISNGVKTELASGLKTGDKVILQ